MWKKIIVLVTFILAFSLLNTSSHALETEHLQSIKKRHPFGVLTDDYGILSEEDLQINECDNGSKPLPPKTLSLLYWQCFKTSAATFNCEEEGYNQDEKAEMAILGIDINIEKKHYSYVSRRAFPMKGCRQYQKDWKRLKKNQNYFCISGSPQLIEKSTSEETWFFDKYKTKNGCNSYFTGACSLKYQIKLGCKITQK